MITIRKATVSDVKAIVEIHKQAFPDFFLTTLGERFLRLYYGCMCKSGEALTLCAMDEGKLMGFSSTALKSAGFNTRLIKHNIMKFAVETMRLLFTRATALVRLVNNFTKKSSDVKDDGDYAELFSIGVSPLCQGKGVGSLLLSENERIIREWGGKKAIANNR
jgi:ribosomal protein S18 acetylase RimI-like enzyme